jgi:uncharacterized protein YbjT (DUF2867 family)
MTGQRRVVVFGATGTAGSAVVRECLADERIAEVRAITRRSLGFADPKLRDIHCADFAHPEEIAHQLTGVDACFFCLGVSARGNDEEYYREVTLTYPLAAADVLRERSPEHTFVHLSAGGTDTSGRSRMLWARVKGETENQLRQAGLRRLIIARPGYIYPGPDQRPHGAGAALRRAIFPTVSAVLPGLAIRAEDLARGMIEAALGDSDHTVDGVLDNRALRALAARHPAHLS